MSFVVDVARLGVAFAVCLAVGGVAVAAAIPRCRSLGWPLVVALAFTVGFGVVTITMFTGSLIGLSFAQAALLLLPWLLVIAWVRRRAAVPDDDGGTWAALPTSLPGVTEASVVFGLVVVLNVLTVAFLALDKPVWNYDALSRWMFKARAFYADGSVLPYYADLERGVTQPHYPPFVSLASTWIHTLLGREDDRLVKSFFLAVFVALNLAVYGIARRRASMPVALLAVAVLSSLPCFSYLDSPSGVGAASALADVPLALITLLAAGLLLDWMERGVRGSLVLSSALCGLAVWTKQEGALLLIFVPLLAIASSWRRGARGSAEALALSLLPGLLVMAPWYLFQRGVPITDDVYYPIDFGAARVMENLERVPVIVERYLREFTWWSVWNLFWPLVAVAIVVAPRSLLRNGGWPLLLLALLHFAAYFAVYVLDDFLGVGAYEQKMEITITRLMMHVAPVAAVLLARQLESVAADVRR